MNKMLLISLLGILLNIDAFSHDQTTHQYIVREAYNLLKKDVGVVPILNEYIGTTQGRNSSNPWNSAYVVAGAFDEDARDVVYHHGDINNQTILQNGLWNADMGLTTLSHFWRISSSDLHQDDDHVTHVTPLGIPFDAENAWTKVRAYRDGGWDVWVWDPSSNLPGKVYRYSSLINLYNTGNVLLVKEVNTLGQEFFRNVTTTLSEGFKKKLVFNILGRMAQSQSKLSPEHYDFYPFIGRCGETVNLDDEETSG